VEAEVAALLQVAELAAAYDGVQALHGVGLEVAAGEIVCVLGANGAGKTTLLRVISGLLPARGGSVRFDGQDLVGRQPEDIVRLGMVHVPQGRMVFASLTVRENLVMGGFVQPASKAREGIERAVAYFPRLGERMTQRAGTLSGGEQQMLAIARGLMSRPRLLMLDEPSMGVAPVIKDFIFDKLGDIRRQENTAILLVEQDADVALAVADRGYVLETGAVVLQGRADDLRANEDLKRAYLGG
jgi:branched-chain amino acid transport system ATP-binding protein